MSPAVEPDPRKAAPQLPDRSRNHRPGLALSLIVAALVIALGYLAFGDTTLSEFGLAEGGRVLALMLSCAALGFILNHTLVQYKLAPLWRALHTTVERTGVPSPRRRSRNRLGTPIMRADLESLANRVEVQYATLSQQHEQLQRSERELQRILDQMHDTYYRTDENGLVVRTSASVQTLLGYTQEYAIGVQLADIYATPADRDRFLERLMGAGAVRHNITHLRHADGHVVTVSTNAHMLYDDTGRFIGVEGTTRDISEQLRQADLLYREKEQATVTLQSIADAVITTDADAKVSFLNPVAEQLCGWTTAQAEGRSLAEVLLLRHEEDDAPVANPASEALSLGQTVQHAELWLTSRSGHDYAIHLSAAPIRNASGDLFGVVVVFRDDTETRAFHRRISWQAHHDSLTGLVNRHELHRRLDEALQSARSEQLQHAFLYLDLDRFKVVNDSCGHHAGDKLLRQIAFLLKREIRETDTLGRLGGDEFGVLLEDCPEEQARDLAERLLHVIEKYHFYWEDQQFDIGVSIGLVTIDATAGPLVDVLRAADSACYEAKHSGRHRVHRYQGDGHELERRRSELEWVEQLRQAMHQNTLEVHLRPILPLNPAHAADRSSVVEMSLHLPSGTEDASIRLEQLMAAAERFNLMPELDRWTLRSALRLLRERPSIRRLHLSLSGESINEDTFAAQVGELMRETGVSGERLCFEVTEKWALSNIPQLGHLVASLQGSGCQFALKGFGNGPSALTLLRDLPVGFVKISGRLVANAHEEPFSRKLLEAIHALTDELGIATIAEDVRHPDALSTLQALGIQCAQGSLIAPAEPAHANPSMPAGEIA